MKTTENSRESRQGRSQSGAKAKQPPGKLKAQLQAKSRSRREQHTAETKVKSAASSHGRNDLRPALRLRKLPTQELRACPDRTRQTTPTQLERVIRSIRQFGLVAPVLIDGRCTIVSGHVIWEAARELGLETVDCIAIDHLNETEIKALSIALNRMAETGTWDLDKLREQLIVIESEGIELTATGFTLPEIDQILVIGDPVIEEPASEGEDETEKTAVPVSREGDLFQLGSHRLLCGDALDAVSYEQLLEGNLAQCVFSDPPYNCPIDGFVSGLGQHSHDDFAMAVGEMNDDQFQNFLSRYLAHCRSFTSQGAVIFACIDWRQIDHLLAASSTAELKRKNIAVWNKGSGGMGSLYRSAHEFIVVLCNDETPATNNIELGRHGRDRTNVWSYAGANRRGSSSGKALADHPTPKPVEMVEDALLDVTNRGEIVLDPFLGSGTTMIAAERAGRICCGIELDPKYVDRAIRRWEAFTGEHAIHVATGMTFDALANDRAQNEEDGDA